MRPWCSSRAFRWKAAVAPFPETAIHLRDIGESCGAQRARGAHWPVPAGAEDDDRPTLGDGGKARRQSAGAHVRRVGDVRVRELRALTDIEENGSMRRPAPLRFICANLIEGLERQPSRSTVGT